MRALVLVLISFLISAGASAEEPFSCGGATVEFNFSRFQAKEPTDYVETVMSVSREGRSTMLYYDTDIDFIGGTCTRDKHNKPMIVFQVYCGGSGCHDLDNWGIIDPESLLVRLVPNDWNRSDAEKILGRPLPKIDHMISIARDGEKL
jgi:hypothetical protein